MTTHSSQGWESVATEFVAARSDIGSGVVRQWAKLLPLGGDVMDIGCGAGIPISATLAEAGLTLFGIDASPTLLSMYRHRFPEAHTACETVQSSDFFGRQFDGAAAIGLMFLLFEDDQRKLITSVAKALKPDGRFLFSAPRQACEWKDLQIGQRSLSLGEAHYQRLLDAAGMRLTNVYVDEGGNHYFDATM